ncbi:MAG: FAD-dependent oxidoreductase, partial [Ochrobactrum anthropi]
MNDCCATSSRDNPAVSQPATLASFAVRPGVTFPDWSAVTSPVVKNALQAMVGSDHVLNRWSGYDPATDRVRVALLRLYADHGGAPTISALAERTKLSEMVIRPLLDELRRRDLVVLDGELIVGAYPFSDHNTGHRVTLDGRTLNAMCAVDALGIGAMTDRDTAIASPCGHCGALIRITTQDRGRALADVEPQSAVMWQSVRYEGGCAASSLCATTAFFCSDEHLSAWRDERSTDEPGFRLSIEEGLEAGRALFGPSLAGLDVASKSLVVANRPLRTNGRNGGAYDLVVIGAGSAGFSASITAADQGAQVALIGSGTIGGTCVNVGCVPSKTMIRAAEALHGAGAASRFAGLAGEAHLTDWRALIGAKDDLVGTLRQKKYVDLLPEYNGIAYLEGAARLNGAGVLVNDSPVAAGKIIVATGASPAIANIPGIENIPYLTSTTALELDQQPRSLLVIGGGYIGCELAQMFARTGTAVTMVTRSRLLPEAEPEIAQALARYLADEGITVRTGLTYSRIEQQDGEITLTIDVDGRAETLTAEQVLVTTG